MAIAEITQERHLDLLRKGIELEYAKKLYDAMKEQIDAAHVGALENARKLAYEASKDAVSNITAYNDFISGEVRVAVMFNGEQFDGQT